MKKIYRTFFFNNLATFLIPMLIPLLILGTLSTYLIQQYIKENINSSNMNLLKQTKENTELIFNELDSLNLYIVASATEFLNLKKMVNKEWLESDDYKQLASLKNFIDTPNIARPYIDSIYIYIENDKGLFITSTKGGLVKLNEFYDRAWFGSFIKNQSNESVWTEGRTINKVYPGFPDESVNLITMYRKVSGETDGVIVLNINTNYIENHLASLSTIKDQSLLIVDKNYDVIFKKQEVNLENLDMEPMLSNPSATFSMEIGGESFIVSKLFSNKYEWTFLSVSPKSSFYEVPKRLNSLTLLLVCLSTIGGTVLALYLTKKNYNDVKTIIKTLHSVEQGNSPPPLPARLKGVYSYIIQKILKNFMENNYLKVQISERKYRAQAMEFAALQSQLNPHFLFNTLETINWKAISLTGKPNKLNYMLERLADILRYSLDGENKMVNLHQEITYTLSYIEIQKVRYKEKFNVIWEYDQEVLKYQVIKLILQPLIENSLSHGLDDEGKCVIKIKIGVTATSLKISIIDNGMGISPEKLTEIRDRLDSNTEQTEHIGLSNTHKRLKLTYGEAYGLMLKSKLGWGTAVHLIIPRDKG